MFNPWLKPAKSVAKKYPLYRRQQTSQELRDELLRFIQVHFYPSNPLQFAKDRPRLLEWVVLKVARWLDIRSVTVTPERYLEIVRDRILMPALQHGSTGQISYLPAWLGKVVDSHMAVHGEDYYYAAKTARDATQGALAIARAGIGQSDPIRDLAAAARLLKTAPKRPSKPPIKAQLNLL